MRFGNLFFYLLLIVVLFMEGNAVAQTSVPPAVGNGSEVNPYQIATLNNLYWLSQNSSVWDKEFIQTADINAAASSTWDSDSGFTPIGNLNINFKGSYNANGHIIDSLYIDRPSKGYIGLFGFVRDAEIYGIEIINANIEGRDYTSLLVGYSNNSTIERCYGNGNVSGNDKVGSIVGQSVSSSVNNSYSSGSVLGVFYAGGLVGRNFSSSTINNSYSICSVDGYGYVGGLVGHNSNSIIEKCFSSGRVSGSTNVGGLVGYGGSDVENSFWDSEASGQAASAGGTAKTTIEMKMVATFTDTVNSSGLSSAWDFSSNPNNDTNNDDCWDIDQENSINNGYPILSWQEGADNKVFYSGGDGSSSDPYKISVFDDLVELSNIFEDWDSHFIQTNDISANSTYNLSQIGTSSKYFTGDYNGGGYKIDSLYIDASSRDYIGLFGFVSRANIENLGLTNVNISGHNTVGGLVGQNYHSVVKKCYCCGNVSGNDYVGGLVGINNNSSTVSESYSSGRVLGNDYIGGLVGNNYNSTVEECYSICSDSGGIYIGGLVGINSLSNIKECYSNGTVLGHSNVGGLAGYNYNSSTIDRCYSSSSVSGSSSTGGLVGYNGSTVSNSFWNSMASGQSSSSGGTAKTTTEMKMVATFTDTVNSVGLSSPWDFVSNPNDDTNDNNYWDMDQEAIVNSGYPILSWQDGADTILALVYSGGDGSETKPYKISTFDDLKELSSRSEDWDSFFIQTNEITVNSKYNFTPIGNNSVKFTGNYNGKGYKIDSLHIDASSTNYVGLFGYIYGANIDSLGVVHANIRGNYRVGALVGSGNNSSTIKDCHSSGTVFGSRYVGGLIGYTSNSTIENCYSTCSDSGDSYLGGFTGLSSLSTIKNCYSGGSVNGNSIIGGFVGYNTGSSSIIENGFSECNVSGGSYLGGLVGYNYMAYIKKCYSRGSVVGGSNVGGLIGYNNDDNTVSNSFWDIETSGRTSSRGGTGKLSVEMKNISTFTDTVNTEGLFSAWDFVGNFNDDNANEDYWDMKSYVNDGYPYLSWQDVSGSVPTAIDFGAVSPKKFILKQNYPNPFNPSTTIGFSIAELSDVKLVIYDMLGRKIRSIEMGEKLPGDYSIIWNGKNDLGLKVSTGVYLYRVIAGNNIAIKKMILVK